MNFERESARLAILRFPMMLLILYIHSFVAPVFFADGVSEVAPSLATSALAMALSDGLARIAVPLFYAMSGYLYFRNFGGTLAEYGTKTRRRVRTLLIPYLLWNGMVLTLFIVGQSLPQTAPFFNAGNVAILDSGPWGILDSWIGVTHYPIAYQFWFIRDLMLLALLAPLFYLIIARLPYVVEAALLLSWLFFINPPITPAFEPMTFFVLGGSAAFHRRSLFALDRMLPWTLAIYPILLALDVASRLSGWGWWLYRPTILVGIVMALGLSGIVVARRRLAAALLALSSASFFLFAAHEPLLTMVRKLCYRFLPASQPMILLVYLVAPLVVAGTALAAYFLLARTAPRFTAVLTGGREGSGGALPPRAPEADRLGQEAARPRQR